MIIKKVKDWYQIGIFLFFILFLGLPILISKLVTSPEYKISFRPHAQETAVGGIDGIQKMINLAKDGATITIPAGTYSGNTAIPIGLGDAIYVSAGRGGAATCFLRIEKKNITLKGPGAIIFGEGHDSKAGVDPYTQRAGVCVIDSKVTFDNVHVKEFQKRCIVAYNSTIVVKNSTIDGCDEGGASLLGNSAGLFVNNMFVAFNFGGIMLWQNSQAKIVNNTFWGASVTFFYHPGTDDKAYAEIINNIFENYSSVIQVDWWPAENAKLKTNKLSYNLIHKRSDESACGGEREYCADFPGKITGDPLFIEPVVDPRGIAAWANFGFKDGSPAVGVGDPSIPGPKNLGNSGGPCAEPSSSTCTSFIQSNIPKVFEQPVPTSPPEAPIVDNTNQTQNNIPPVQQVVPTAVIRTQHPVDSSSSPFANTKKETGVLFVTNKSTKKNIQLIGVISNNSQSIRQEIGPGASFKYVYSNSCDGNKEVNLGIIYASSEDNYESMRYKYLIGYCDMLTVLGIE